MRNPYANHLAEEVSSADPLDLVVMLYEGALKDVAQARRSLERGDATARAASISRAMEIIGELSRSLNEQAAAEMAGRLGELYAYVLDRLREANFEQRDEPLAEVENLLAVLADAWRQCRAMTQPERGPGVMDMGALSGEGRLSAVYSF